MRIVKKVSTGVAFAKKEPYEWEGKKYEADIKDGDNIKILNEGSAITGQFGDQIVFLVSTRNGEKTLPLNQSSLNVLHDELGEESKEWIGKEVRVILQKGTFAGKRGVATYIVTGDWHLDEWGELVKPSIEQGDDQESSAEIAPEDIPF